MPESDPRDSSDFDAEPRAFVLRIRARHRGSGHNMVVTVDDVTEQSKSHFKTLEAAFAEIRRALNQPPPAPGQPH